MSYPLTLILTFMIFGQLFGQKMQDVDDGYVFDKAKYHFDSVNEAGLDQSQAYVHSGLFLAWLIDNDLISDYLKEESEEEINRFKRREISPGKIYYNWDGALIGDLLNREGYNFALHYFDFEKGRYLADYEKTLRNGDPDLFRVKDSWENYDKLKVVIDKAYTKWRKNHWR